MANPQDSASLPASERMKEVALLLKQADKLVKEGELAKALDLIAKARSYDSRHLYALAYEERVRTLLTAKQQEEAKKAKEAGEPFSAGAKKSEEPKEAPADQKVAPSLQHLSNLAIIEAQHSAAVAAQQEQASELQKKEEEAKAKNEELRRNAIESKLAAFLSRANQYFQRKEYSRALDEIARAYLLDPVNEKIHALEDTIRKVQEDARRSEDAERQKKIEEERQKRQTVLKTQSEKYQKEQEEKAKREELERKRVQEEKVKQYMAHVNELFQANKLDEALSELAFVVVIDPLNEEVLRLEQKIIEIQEQQQQAQLQQYQKQLEERQKKREAIVATIRKHIANAEQFAKQKKFADALRTITRATVLDPINDELQQCERRILALQEEHIRKEEESKRELQEQIRRQQEEEIRRLESIDRERVLEGENEKDLERQRLDNEKIRTYIEKAKSFLAGEQFEAALGEVALAFIINPFDNNVKEIEQEILARREEYQALNRQAAQQTLLDEQQMKAETEAKIKMHLQEADRLRTANKFSKAFNEVAKAFILDPLNTEVQNFEQMLQDEFDLYLSNEHDKQSQDDKTREIQRYVDHASEFLTRERFEEALSEVAHGLTIDANHAGLLALKEKITAAAEEWKKINRKESRNVEIGKLLVIAREYKELEKFDEAKIAVTKALELDPGRQESIDLLTEINASGAQTAPEQPQINPKQKAADHLARAQQHLKSNIYDKAIVEIISGLAVDPDNQALLQLEQQVNVLNGAKLSSDLASATAPARRISREEKDRLIRIHLRVATEFRTQKEYARALDEIAHGYTIDSENTELMALDKEIRAEQAEHDLKSAQGLKLVYSSGRAAG